MVQCGYSLSSEEHPPRALVENAAASMLDEEDTASMPCGPDVEPVLASVRQYLEAGYDHLYFHQIGPDQHGFFEFWQHELRPALGQLGR